MIKVTALVITEETVGECIKYSRVYAWDVESRWNVVSHGGAQEGKWRGNWWMEWVASTLHTTSEHGVSSITTADAHTSPASSRLNWRPVSPKDEIWFLRVCHHISNAVYKMVTAFRDGEAYAKKVWPFRILAAMTALLMELKGNREHWNWWFRSSQFIALPTDTFFMPWSESRAKKISANVIAQSSFCWQFSMQLRLLGSCVFCLVAG